MNLFAKFHENIPNLSQETEKNTENVPPSPKKLNSKSAQVMGNIPPHTHTHKVFLYYSHQIIINNICAKFHNKSNGSTEKEKKIPQN